MENNEQEPMPAPEPTPVPTPVPPPAPAPTPEPAPRPGRTVAIVISIVAAVLIVLGGLSVALYFLATSVISQLAEAQPSSEPQDDEPTEVLPPVELLPLVEGAPSAPVAAEPLVCVEECFTLADLDGTVPPTDWLEALGVPIVDSTLGDYSRSTPGREFTSASRTWVENEGAPDECFFTYIPAPIATTIDNRPASGNDSISYVNYSLSDDEYSSLDLTARLFGDSASAETHMSTLSQLVTGCTDYEIGTGASYWTADVTPVPALTLPPSVAATGWVEDSPFGRYYIVDLQRGNLVVRATLATDGMVLEEDFRTFAEELAGQLADMQPN